MKISDLINHLYESGSEFTVRWPTNLAWRIKFKRFKNDDLFLDVRRNKAFAMPFQNWQSTFVSLTGKDLYKVKYMPTEVIFVTDGALVGDMSLINQAQQNKKNRPQILIQYENSLVKYEDFVQNPKMFKMPEILVDLPMQIAPYNISYNNNATSYDELLYVNYCWSKDQQTSA
jgi:hypothetical protein